MNSLYESIETCRICGTSDLAEVMAFGNQYLASCFVKSNDEIPLARMKVPLTILLCEDCGLIQLKETVKRNALFQDYFYRSATNPMMRDALKDVASDMLGHCELKPGDYVLDIGCNDGTLLSYFPEDINRVGVEPATNIDWNHLDPSISILNSYFSKELVEARIGTARFSGISSIAMMYSVERINEFANHVRSLLAPDGSWCIQVTYLPTTLKNLGFYDVCHEHLMYFSLHSLRGLLVRHGLKIYDASLNYVNGGSLRVHVAHEENKRISVSENVKSILQQEVEQNIEDQATYESFFRKVMILKEKVISEIEKHREKNNVVIGLGASTKGNVLLQFFDLDKARIPYLSDRDPHKVGLRTLGTDIEVISEQRARELKPLCMLVLIWYFKEEIVKREEEYLRQGGRLLFPMPYCHVVSNKGEKIL